MKILTTYIKILILAATMLLSITDMAMPSQQLLRLSIESLPLAKGEKIIGFQVNIIAGRILSLPNIPNGWNITIDNDPSWKTKLTGSLIVGSAALGINSFKDFIVVEKYEFMNLKFGIEAEIIVTKDFEKERHIHLKTKDLIIKPI